MGKTIGELALYDQHGLRPKTCRWLIGGFGWPLNPIDFVPHTHLANVQVPNILNGKEPGAMPEAGEANALIPADLPKYILQRSPRVARAQSIYPGIEREYFK